MSKIDEKLQAFKTEVDTQLAAFGSSLTSIGTSVANIAADEQNILAQLAGLADTDLTPAQQTVLTDISTNLTAAVAQTTAAAASLQTLANNIPDVPVPPVIP